MSLIDGLVRPKILELNMAKTTKIKRRPEVEAEKWKTVLEPFVLENDIAKKINEYRVAGNTTGDSNEWYHLSPEQLWNVVIETATPTN